ncbi:MAG: folate-binding protein, partial [Gemmatimonadota bacterium]
MITPLSELALRSGGRPFPAGDLQMPADYGDPAVEYRAARSGAVVRDASHWARLELAGPDHLDFLHRLTTGSFRDLSPGAGLRTVFPDNRGRIVTCGAFTRLDETRALGILPPQGRVVLPAWLDRFHFSEAVSWIDRSAELGMLELGGPMAAQVVAAVLGCDVAAAPEAALLPASDTTGMHLLRYDHLGGAGLRLLGPPESLRDVWSRLLAAGACPLGEDVAEVLRIESGTPGPRELTTDHNPWEAGLGHLVHANKGCYIGQEVIARLSTYDKVKQRLVGVTLAPEGT